MSSSVTVLNGDCLKIVPTLGKFAFVFADPPFNIDQAYLEYKDAVEAMEFRTLVRSWVGMCREASNGIVALHGNDNMVELYLDHAALLGMRRIAWINWHYRFGQCSRNNWIDARCHCLVYAVAPKHTWNPESVLVESDRVAYGDKRVNETERGGKRLPGTVWGVPSDGPYWGRVQGTNQERRKGHPNQLPEVYLKRLILAYTNPGDKILDPFGGSGTTAVVADALGRSCVTIDISKKNCNSIAARLQKGAVRV